LKQEGSVGSARGFYFDLADPRCWPAVELLPRVVPTVPFAAVRGRKIGVAERGEVEEVWEVAKRLGLLPARPPKRLAAELEEASLAAVYAAMVGKGVAFAQAAFRHAFAAGRDLSSWDNVVIVGASCEIHPRALAAALRGAGVHRRLEENEREAERVGVVELPAVVLEGRVHQGLEAVLALVEAEVTA
jgi:2-hydroxychromene-2-carboxylate isomerase